MLSLSESTRGGEIQREKIETIGVYLASPEGKKKNNEDPTVHCSMGFLCEVGMLLF